MEIQKIQNEKEFTDMGKFSIAIDGPAGAGKSTVARAVAAKLAFIYVDTGAMYRAIGLYMIQNQINPKEDTTVAEAVEKAEVSIRYQEKEQQVLLNGENVNGKIRTEEVGKMASAISGYKKVRTKLVELQRKLAQQENVVMDGRDIGTKVLPNADLKIYLTASVKERAKRRYLELEQKKITCNIKEIEKDIIDRDNQDMNRKESPLCKAEDAVYTDCSNMTAEEVAEHIVKLFQQKTEIILKIKD